MSGGATLTYHTYCPYLIELVLTLVFSTPAWNHVHSSFLAKINCQEQFCHRDIMSRRIPFRQPLHRRLNVFNRLIHRHAARLCFQRDLRLRLESDPRQGGRSSSGMSRCHIMNLVLLVGASFVKQTAAYPNVCRAKHCGFKEEAHLIWQPTNHQAHEVSSVGVWPSKFRGTKRANHHVGIIMFETLFFLMFCVATATLLEMHDDRTLLCKLMKETNRVGGKMGIGYDLMVTCCHTLAANYFVCAVIRTALLEYLRSHGNLCPLQYRDSSLKPTPLAATNCDFRDTHLNSVSSLDCNARFLFRLAAAQGWHGAFSGQPELLATR